MDIKKLEVELKKLGEKKIDLNLLLAEVSALKDKSIQDKDELTANILWVYKTILEIHKIYNQAFVLLKAKKYNDGWNLLERAEIEVGFLKPHLHLVKGNYKMRFIEAAVMKLQSLFPYRLFISTEMLSLEEICGICRKKISVRNPCGHIIGQLYMEEMCFREASKMDFLGTAIVENPVNKYSVMFQENEDVQIRDKDQFGNLNYLLNLIKSPYESWTLEISQRSLPHSNFPNLKPTDPCPCRDGKNYSECCLLEDGIQYFHYQFDVNKDAIARLISKRAKKRK